MNFPETLKYTREHEWLRVEGGEAVIGITDFAQRELGEVVFVELQEADEELAVGDRFGTIEAVKTVTDLFMPVSGTILSINSDLEAAPETINKDPYGAGWLIRIKINEISEVEGLLSAADYTASLEQ
jgi:glycine cleavage system H protein